MSDLPEHITDASFAAHMEAAQLIAASLGQERAEIVDVARALAHAYGEVLALYGMSGADVEAQAEIGAIAACAAGAMVARIQAKSCAGSA